VSKILIVEIGIQEDIFNNLSEIAESENVEIEDLINEILSDYIEEYMEDIEEEEEDYE